jgi:hypothetical protein
MQNPPDPHRHDADASCGSHMWHAYPPYCRNGQVAKPTPKRTYNKKVKASASTTPEAAPEPQEVDMLDHLAGAPAADPLAAAPALGVEPQPAAAPEAAPLAAGSVSDSAQPVLQQQNILANMLNSVLI